MFALFFLATVTNPQEALVQKAAARDAMKKQTAQHNTVAARHDTPSRSVMMITPKERATDYEKAFQMLRQEKSSGKVFFTLASGEKVANVIDLKLMPSSTVVVFRMTTAQGTKLRVVDIEDIIGIQHE